MNTDSNNKIIHLQHDLQHDLEKELQKELKEEEKYKPPESWIKNLKPLVSSRIISSRIITKEEYNRYYCKG
jgi:bacterioferritin (cytochrome b1)